MKWLRSNIRHGSRLALFALIIQFALSFGHFHRSGAEAAFAIQTGQAQSGEPQSPVSHDTDQQTSDACDICAVVALANMVLLATPPLLLLPQAIEFLYLATDAEFAHLDSARIAFQPRAPPVS
jgi:hypothetical protein